MYHPAEVCPQRVRNIDHVKKVGPGGDRRYPYVLRVVPFLVKTVLDHHDAAPQPRV